jgi:acyl carrier protein
MGLDSVELILDVERAFGIETSDPELRKIETVGEFYELIVSKLEVNNREVDRQQVWEGLKSCIIKISGVPPDKIIPEARIVKDLGID